jgi:hypothetical protein
MNETKFVPRFKISRIIKYMIERCYVYLDYICDWKTIGFNIKYR